jgi:hemoglobin
MSGPFSRLALFFAVLSLPASARAEDASLHALDARVRQAVLNAIGQGVAVYNRGDHDGCYRIYQGALTALAPILEHRPKLQGTLARALKDAERRPMAWQRAYALRPALDAILEAIPRPAAAAASLYDRLGGATAIEAVVADFVGRAAANPKVNFTRKGTDLEWEASEENVARLKKHLVQFVSMATGGPTKYEGRDMKAAHRGMQITDAEFDALAAELKATLDKFKVPAKEQKELLTIVGSTRGQIVEKK